MAFDSPYETLSEILTSNRVGLTHVQLVGEVIVAQAQLNRWFAEQGKAKLSPDGWAETAERILTAEDAYRLLWQELNSSNGGTIGTDGLRQLENALRNAASTFQRIYSDLKARHG